MRVGIIGSGQVGQTLAQGFSTKGHDVMAPYIEGMALAAINWVVKANDWTWGLKLARG